MARTPYYWPGYLPAILLLAIVWSCTTDPAKKPAYSKTRQLQAFITSPAGTTGQFYYDAEAGKITERQHAGHPAMLNYLPYPVNYGFIPGTLADTVRGGDGEPLDVLVIAQAVNANTLMEVIPLAVVQLATPTGTDTRIVAVPSRPSERIIEATTLEDLTTHYPSVKQLLHLWLSNSQGEGKIKVMSWRNEEEAEKEVQKWLR